MGKIKQNQNWSALRCLVHNNMPLLMNGVWLKFFEQKCVTARGRKNPFEFSFLSISRNLCIFIKNFACKFFVENWISNNSVCNRGHKKPFKFIFWWKSRNWGIFKKNIARKFIVGNWIWNKCIATRGRKKPCEIQCLVNKSKSMHFS